ncbi:MAG: type II secretion system protein [Candidatus Omnitrophica bacterium]|nr:type II secretion system protein [Candidatus Omnitrophota bacterium]
MKMRDQHGWTLLEVVIAISIFTILGMALTTLYATGNTLMQVSQNKLHLQQQCRLSLDRVLKELRLARASSVTINASQDSISFQIPQSVDTNTGAITWSPTITYSVVSSTVGTFTNNQLIRTQAGSANIVMANDINNDSQDPNRLLFTGNQAVNPSLITVQMSMNRITLRGHPAVSTLTGQVKVRNS